MQIDNTPGVIKGLELEAVQGGVNELRLASASLHLTRTLRSSAISHSHWWPCRVTAGRVLRAYHTLVLR